jgi:hypothetical protein
VSQASAILATSDPECAKTCAELAKAVNASEDPKFFAMPVVEGLNQPKIPVKDMFISADHVLNPERAWPHHLHLGHDGTAQGCAAEAFVLHGQLGDFCPLVAAQ